MTTDVIVPTAPPLANIYGVELIRSGTWDISTGEWTVTDDDLTAAVAALECPGVRSPVLKLGHVDPRFDGEPALGYVGHLATRDHGSTLVGDYLGMPGWLAAPDDAGNTVIASAYPDRSIEGEYDFRCQIGHTHPFVLTAVALLGVSRPGIGNLQSLQDIGALYGVVAASGPASGTRVRCTVRAAAPAPAGHTGAMIALVPAAADADRLAVDGGETVDELHVTLRYLGEGADFDADQQAAVIDAVRAVAASTGPIAGDADSIALLNPENDDRETCVVLVVNGPGLDPAHDAVTAALDGLDLPELPAPPSPWLAHLTLEYTDDADQVAALADRCGPVTFDRLRVAFAGDVTDIQLTGPVVAASAWSYADHLTAGVAASVADLAARLEEAGLLPRKDNTMPNPTPREVAAGVTTEDVRRKYYDDAGWDYWITEVQLEPLQLIVCDEGSGKKYRIPITISGDDFTFGDEVEVTVVYVDKTPAVAASAAASRLVYASRAESRLGVAKATDAPAETTPPPVPAPTVEPAGDPVDPTPQIPAPEPTNPPITEEDSLSTITSDVRSRLGLPDDADDAAVLAALDALNAKAEAPAPTPTPAPEPDLVAAAAEHAAELRRVSTELAEIKAEKAADDRKTLFDAVVHAGKIAPADREKWEARYDAAPAVIADVLASIAAGTAVPVAVAQAGYPSAGEPSDADAALTEREQDLFPPIKKG